MDADRIKRLRELYAAGTQGPWLTGPYGTVHRTKDDGTHGSCIVVGHGKACMYDDYQANCALIAAMHEALPDLLALAEAVPTCPGCCDPLHSEPGGLNPKRVFVTPCQKCSPWRPDHPLLPALTRGLPVEGGE